MLSINQLTKAFGGSTLFSDISFRLTPGDRVGLIGKNGAGKTTLMRLIIGEERADSGNVALEKGRSIGFLKQDMDFEKGRTVLEEAYTAFTELQRIESRIDEINTDLAKRNDHQSESYQQLIIQLHELSEQFELQGGYTYQGDTDRILTGLGFKQEELIRPTDTFSGGWRMRIELAKLLLQQNDILLLDEPTNHLDIESIIWLEQFLAQFKGAILMVSHDKMFLDRVTNRTIEISLGRIYDYNKPYSQFLALREEIREQQRNAKKNQDREIQQAERLINRFRAKSTKAAMAQSLIKKLEKMVRIEVDEVDDRVMRVHFPKAERSGRVVAELREIRKSFDENLVLDGVNLRIERGNKIAFVGKNGEGKTTLARILVGDLQSEGEIKLGHNVNLGYFAQDQLEYLDGGRTALESMQEAASERMRTKVRDILGAFLFSGDDADKYIRVLSGGERNRLALARMLVQPFNVLVMDEPTNHLDIQSKNVLKDALLHYEGTLVIVSHDREFMQGLTDRVYEFRNGGIKEHLGDIDFFLKKRQLASFREIELAKKNKEPNSKPERHNLDYEEQKRLKSLRNKLGAIEKKIHDIELEIGQMDEALELNYDSTASDPAFFDRYQERKENLEKLMLDWENITKSLE